MAPIRSRENVRHVMVLLLPVAGTARVEGWPRPPLLTRLMDPVLVAALYHAPAGAREGHGLGST